MLKVVFHESYLKYDFGPGHPFWSERAKVFLEKMKKYRIPHEILVPEKASDEDILLVHTKDYLNRVKRLARKRGALSIDTPVNPNVLEASYYSVGGSIIALKRALKEEQVMNLLAVFITPVSLIPLVFVFLMTMLLLSENYKRRAKSKRP